MPIQPSTATDGRSDSIWMTASSWRKLAPRWEVPDTQLRSDVHKHHEYRVSRVMKSGYVSMAPGVPGKCQRPADPSFSGPGAGEAAVGESAKDAAGEPGCCLAATSCYSSYLATLQGSLIRTGR